MEIVIILIVVAVLVIAGAGFVVSSRRRDRGEVLEPPGKPPTQVTERTPREDLTEPEVEEVEPIGSMFGDIVEVTGPELTEDEEAENIALAEAAELEWETDHGEGTAVEELVRPSFRERLGRARSTFSGYVGSILSRSSIDAETWDELEEAMIRADVGVAPTQALLDSVRATVKEQDITSPEALIEAVKAEMKVRLVGPVELRRNARPSVWLFVGVNGVGKTTTIGKLSARLHSDGASVVMAAGDTFRAAAAEQLGMWADRTGADIVRGAEGGDPSAIIFDAIASASSKGADVVLAD
ncbi:MAG: signal recognition particle receptor subunit alpha, partial [Acidimicrobiales bacterium]